MPRFKVYRYKRYEAHVEAYTAELAAGLAQNVAGRDWRLIEDKVEGVAAGLDNAQQRLDKDRPFKARS